VAAGQRTGRRVIGSLARPAGRRPLHLIHGGAFAVRGFARWGCHYDGTTIPLLDLACKAVMVAIRMITPTIARHIYAVTWEL